MQISKAPRLSAPVEHPSPSQEHSNLLSLPGDTLAKTYRYLHPEGRAEFARTCIALRDVHRRLNEHLTLRPEDLEKSDARVLRDYEGLQSLELTGEITAAHLHLLGRVAGRLRHLDLSWVDELNDESLSHVAELTNLTTLNLGRADNNPDFRRNFSDQSIAQLGRLSALKRLDLSGCQGFRGEGFSAWNHLSRLESLSLDSTELVSGGLNHLTVLARLSKLSLVRLYRLNDEGLHALSKITTLTKLDLEAAAEGEGGGRFTDDGLARLGQLTRLETLVLDDCHGFNGQAFSRLTPLGKLKHLSLDGVDPLDSDAIRMLGRFTQLESLKMAGQDWLSGEEMASWSGLKNLNKLSRSHSPSLADASIEHLAALPALRMLDVSYCNGLGPACIPHLRALTSLTELYLYDALPRIPAEALNSLQRQNLNLSWD